MLLQGTDRLHDRALKVGADTHYLAGGLHLGAQAMAGANELIKGKTGHLYNHVVQHGLKAGIGLFCHRVFNFIQRIAKGDLCRHLGDGIARCLGGQRGRTAYTGIYLDNTIFKAFGMEGVLDVAAAGDPQLGDDL